MFTVRCPEAIATRKDALVFQLFSYMSAVIISILLLQAVAEQALMKAVLKVPPALKAQMLTLAEEANVLIEEGDMDDLADWANAQPFYLFVLNEEHKPLSHRQMHPHFEFKLRFLRELDGPLNDQVSKPLIGIPLIERNTLVIQLPSEVHPAHRFIVYLTVSKIIIAIIMLILFSQILARKLQRPLDRLREASNKLSQGNFRVNVVSELNSNITEFNQLAHDFDGMTQEIHSLAEKQRRLIRDVSHELRTPLARQNLALHLLRKKAGEEEQALVDRLEKEVDEMDKLVGEILEFSRLENSRYVTDVQPVCPESIANTQVNQSRLQLGEDQTLVLNVAPSLPMLHADERLILRCLSNLISNSMKYAGLDALIEVSIGLTSEHGNMYLVFDVADDGPGIPETALEDIFSPFTRIESARDKQSGGYGLGLAIVKEAMTLMKGEVRAQNRSPYGLSIQLYFPIKIGR
ncbi:histidine kinase sensor domain-containing protein [Vibrio neptunius]|uniref:histidine kinase n=1 Tax=Vibrio neptunius TaxID=170651 RepID=A0ABS2ZW49_9VIBR|nr:histidine kinase sensor domain-containing protein [Vibrio neptunius]MBN3514456.1 histidine kinase sensor domain-containing protein [Vibrio neptunius]MBN3548429.1 histidine kinase sensor domain-containing protein [Vibrio neptunius]MBN3576475.1 histidine kinase sensor domain-containing protein [Vibrio neptunius]MCH9870139.1 histidine kinase sensor domain-containing protein [Vibrio neptunius]